MNNLSMSNIKLIGLTEGKVIKIAIDHIIGNVSSKNSLPYRKRRFVFNSTDGELTDLLMDVLSDVCSNNDSLDINVLTETLLAKATIQQKFYDMEKDNKLFKELDRQLEIMFGNIIDNDKILKNMIPSNNDTKRSIITELLLHLQGSGYHGTIVKTMESCDVSEFDDIILNAVKHIERIAGNNCITKQIKFLKYNIETVEKRNGISY